MEEQQQTSDVAGVSSCYVFKSRLQEYAQKAGLTTPIYHTIKEGPSHQPIFRSTVVLNDETYHSLTGFLNRKASEQSAAEVALVEIAKTGSTDKSVSHPVHETGLCKNLLQEYAQKMNYAIPSYICTKDEKKGGRDSSFSCTVDIGGIKYIGTSAKTKKEAELKAAKTALLAIKMSVPEAIEKSDASDTENVYTVVPTKRKAPERPLVEVEDKVKKSKRRKSKFHKRRKKRIKAMGDAIEVKTDKPSPGEVKDLKSNGESVLVPCNNGLEANYVNSNKEFVPCSNNGEVKNLNSNRESIFVPCSNPGEVQSWKSYEESVFVPFSNPGEVQGWKSNGESVFVPFSNPGEVQGWKSNGESVFVPFSNPGEVQGWKSNGESVFVPFSNAGEVQAFVRCSNLGEVKDMKSNGKNECVPYGSVDEAKGLKSSGENGLGPSSNPGEVKVLNSNGVVCSSVIEGLQSNGENVSVSLESNGEVKDLKSNGNSVLVPCGSSIMNEVRNCESNGESDVARCSNMSQVEDIWSNEETVFVPFSNPSEDYSWAFAQKF